MIQNKQKIMMYILTQECGKGRELDGAYHCTPGDLGGCTKFGIAQAWHANINVEHLDQQGALKIYDEDYWTPIGADNIPTGLDLMVMDFAVTSSPHLAMTFLEVLPEGADTLTKMQMFEEHRTDYYKQVAQHPSQAQFLHDWLARVAASVVAAHALWDAENGVS